MLGHIKSVNVYRNVRLNLSHYILRIEIRLSPVGSRIITPNPSNGIAIDMDPCFVGWPVELSQTLAFKKLIKYLSINVVVMVIVILYAYHHIEPSFCVATM